MAVASETLAVATAAIPSTAAASSVTTSPPSVAAGAAIKLPSPNEQRNDKQNANAEPKHAQRADSSPKLLAVDNGNGNGASGGGGNNNDTMRSARKNNALLSKAIDEETRTIGGSCGSELAVEASTRYTAIRLFVRLFCRFVSVLFLFFFFLFVAVFFFVLHKFRLCI